MTEAGRYPFATAEEVTQLVAKKHNVKPENVLLGSGSTQILRTSTHVFTTKTAGLVAAIPAYEECADYARLMGHPITGVKLDRRPQDGPRRAAGGVEGRRTGVLLQPQQPGGHRHRRGATRGPIWPR